MNKNVKIAITLLCTFCLIALGGYSYTRHLSETSLTNLDSLLSDENSIAENVNREGKSLKPQRLMKKVYTKTELDSLALPNLDTRFLRALENQTTLIRQMNSTRPKGELSIEADHLQQVIDIFRATKGQSVDSLRKQLEAYQICGDDQKGNVRFTGYYSPIIAARHSRTKGFTSPVYLKTKNRDGSLEVVYIKDHADVQHMRIEGASYLQFPDGNRQLVSFNGDYERFTQDDDNDNDHTNVAPTKKVLAKYSAVFSKRDRDRAVGAGTTPLTADYTIAVDRNYIPLGAVLLAEVPILDAKGNLVRHEYRFLLAQDTGSAIRGTGHVDLYMGEGDHAEAKAQIMHQYGRIFLLLPKDRVAQPKM